MIDFDGLSQAFSRQTVLCVGDLMLDEFVYGEISRISPEAPAPVIAVQRSETNVGGAGNVARNIAALGARCVFVGLAGEDEAGGVGGAVVVADGAGEVVGVEGGEEVEGLGLVEGGGLAEIAAVAEEVVNLDADGELPAFPLGAGAGGGDAGGGTSATSSGGGGGGAA